MLFLKYKNAPSWLKQHQRRAVISQTKFITYSNLINSLKIGLQVPIPMEQWKHWSLNQLESSGLPCSPIGYMLYTREYKISFMEMPLCCRGFGCHQLARYISFDVYMYQSNRALCGCSIFCSLQHWGTPQFSDWDFLQVTEGQKKGQHYHCMNDQLVWLYSLIDSQQSSENVMRACWKGMIILEFSIETLVLVFPFPL